MRAESLALSMFRKTLNLMCSFDRNFAGRHLKVNAYKILELFMVVAPSLGQAKNLLNHLSILEYSDFFGIFSVYTIFIFIPSSKFSVTKNE